MSPKKRLFQPSFFEGLYVSFRGEYHKWRFAKLIIWNIIILLTPILNVHPQKFGEEIPKTTRLVFAVRYIFQGPSFFVSMLYTLPETNIAPENDGFQVRNLLFQGAPISRGKLLVSGRVIKIILLGFASSMIAKRQNIIFPNLLGFFMVSFIHPMGSQSVPKKCIKKSTNPSGSLVKVKYTFVPWRSYGYNTV